MKTFKQFMRCAAVAVLVMLGMNACSKDEVKPYDWLDQPFAFDISYSTGEAKWDASKPEKLILNKLGVGMTGTVPYLKVKSNTFWTITVPEDCEWLRLSLSADVAFADARKTVGGPTSDVVKTDEQITNVYIKLQENKGDTQEVSLKFRFSSGLEYDVPICQKGAQSSDESSLLTFLKDGFGVVVADGGEDTAIKFYPFTETREGKSGRTYSGVAVAGDSTGRPFSYAGSENAWVSNNSASEEYTILTESNEIPASGGANILLNGKGYFDIRVFNNQGKSDFQFYFGAKNEDGKYRSKDLKLWISKDGVNWTVDANESTDGSIAYERFVSESVNGWALSRAKFSIVPGVSNILYFRFENTSNDAYRIDDILVEEYDGETDQIFSLIQIGSDVIGLPTTFTYTDLKASNTKGNYWQTQAIILSNESGVYKEASEDEEVPTIADANAASAHVQLICAENSRVKTRTDSDGIGGSGLVITSSAPKVTGMYEGDFWIWTLPVHKVSASTNVKAEFTFKETDAGPKYFYFEWAQCTQEEYEFANKNILMFNDEQKREFYNTLDWKVYDPVTIEVPNDVDKAAKSDGIPMGSAKSPAGYWTGEITYSNGFAGVKGGSDVNKEVVCNFPEAMDNGYFFFRLRCANNLTTGGCDGTTYQRINRSTHSGTSYITKTATFAFAGCGKQQEYENAFRVLPSFAESVKDGLRADITPKYINNDDAAVAGVFAGTSANISATTQGNNVLAGSCEVDETGKSLYFYSPYNPSNTDGASNIMLSVPASQSFDNGYLVANSVPVTSVAPVNFKTTNTMRVNAAVRSAILELDLYTGKLFSSNLSRIEISTINPDDESAEGTNIAGSYRYDLQSNTRGEAVALSKTINAKAVEALTVPGERRNALKLYFGLWEGTHKLYLKLYMGSVYYAVPLDVAEFTENNITAFDVQVDKYPSFTATDELTGIANAEQFRAFCEAIKAGKKGKDLDAYRNIDGELGFGGASRDEDKVIDMAGVDMMSWPMATIPESFNGGNYTIKNLKITNAGKVTPVQGAALFLNVAYGYTISNITFDSSCEIDIESDGTEKKENNWAFLCLGTTLDLNGKEKLLPSGNFYNIVNYGDMKITGSHIYNIQLGALSAKAVCAADDVHDQSTITACKNYGKLILRDISTDVGGGSCWSGYRQIGGLVGKNMGMIISDCENHGDIILENMDCKTGLFYVAGIVGYNTNRLDSNATVSTCGLIQNCRNYGAINAGQEAPITVYGLGLAGITGRMQWGLLDKCTNYGAINVKGVAYDAWGKTTNGVAYKAWDAQIKATTNSNAFFSVGGIFAFIQHNIATAATFTELTNAGDIYVECDQPGTITYADNAGVSVGGITGRTGANAFNPHFDGCTNMGNITLKSNVATAEAFVGGICGHFAGNRNDGSYVPYCQGSSNNGTISFVTDNPADVVAHAGGICGSVFYGHVSICVNAGAVNNASTNEASTTGSIIGCQHRSTITKTSYQTVAFTLNGNGVGGSVNGEKITKDNYLQYIYGGYEVYEPVFATNSDGTNSNTFFTLGGN